MKNLCRRGGINLPSGIETTRFQVPGGKTSVLVNAESPPMSVRIGRYSSINPISDTGEDRFHSHIIRAIYYLLPLLVFFLKSIQFLDTKNLSVIVLTRASIYFVRLSSSFAVHSHSCLPTFGSFVDAFEMEESSPTGS
jgi:hypothetical protein